MGIGALYYALEADVSSASLATQIYTIVSFIIFASIFVHGLTIREHLDLSSLPGTLGILPADFCLAFSSLSCISARSLSSRRPAFFLLLTHAAPWLAPRLLGERKAVGQDFGGGDHLLSEEGDDASEEGEERRPTERDPLLKDSSLPR